MKDKNDLSESNDRTLHTEIHWFKKILDFQLSPYTGKKLSYKSIEDIPVPDIEEDDTPYANLIKKEGLCPQERLVLLLILVPIIKPQLLDVFFAVNPQTSRNFTEFGGKADSHYGGFVPTVETALFLLGGRNWRERKKAAELFNPEADFPFLKMIDMEKSTQGGLIFRGVLSLKNAYYSQLIEGRPYQPRFSSEFPAKRLVTSLAWEDLLLNERTEFEIGEILNWLKYNSIISNDWKFKKRMKQGYRSLFYGPSGTGKTLTATLLGQKMNKKVYRVDLSQVISKYIGETEKNLASIFDQAEDKNWILFFDEADALFGKRVKTSTSNDQHSNQQIAYLLQRIEDFPSVIILATNFRGNMDKAFSRRFQSIIHFPAPDENTRLKLWQTTIPEELPIAGEVDLKEIAKKYKVTGGMIVNIVHHAILASLSESLKSISEAHLVDGIQKELAKEGR